MYGASVWAELGPSVEAAFGGPWSGMVASMGPWLYFPPGSGWRCFFKGKFQRKQIKSE